MAKTTPDVPSDSATTPGATAPTPTAFAAWSPPPATTGVPARSPVAAAAAVDHAPGHRRPLVASAAARPDRCASASRTSGDQSRAARSNSSVPGAVGLVERVLAGQAQPDVVLRQEDVGDARPDLGLVVADPHELRGGEPGQRVVAGDRDEPLRPDRLADLVAGLRRSAGRSTGSPGGGPASAASSRTSPCIWPVRPTAATSSPATPGRGEDRPDRRRPRRPTTAPGPARSSAGCGMSKPYSATPIADDRAGLVDQDGLGRGRRRVDAEDVGHAVSAGAGRRPRAVRRPDRLVDEVLEQLLVPGRRRGSISPAATLRLERSRATRVPSRIARAERAVPARIALVLELARARRARAGRRRRGAPGRACRSRRCGRGTGRCDRCSGDAAWHRS